MRKEVASVNFVENDRSNVTIGSIRTIKQCEVKMMLPSYQSGHKFGPLIGQGFDPHFKNLSKIGEVLISAYSSLFPEPQDPALHTPVS